MLPTTWAEEGDLSTGHQFLQSSSNESTSEASALLGRGSAAEENSAVGAASATARRDDAILALVDRHITKSMLVVVSSADCRTDRPTRKVWLCGAFTGLFFYR